MQLVSLMSQALGGWGIQYSEMGGSDSPGTGEPAVWVLGNEARSSEKVTNAHDC